MHRAVIDPHRAALTAPAVEPGDRVLHPVLVVALGEILAGMRAARFLPVERAFHGDHGLADQVVELEGLEEIGVPDQGAVRDLDVGGGASQQRVEAAFKILLGDENVRAVLINIFGGIVRCDMVARGVVGAAQNLGIKVPVVVRLEGTNVEEGQRVIRESGMNFTVAKGMKDAAEKVVALAGS